MTDDALRLCAVIRRHGSGGTPVTAPDRVSLTFPKGTFTAVMGPSGSGKSALLQCAAGLDRPTSGSVSVGGTELTGPSGTRLTALRRERAGFVFRAFDLLPSLTAGQNVVLPLRPAGRRPPRARLREVLFGDEPTGALDPRAGREVLALLRDMVDHEGRTVVMVTHDPVAAARADRVVFLVDGRVEGELTAAGTGAGAGCAAGAVAARMAGLEAAPC